MNALPILASLLLQAGAQPPLQSEPTGQVLVPAAGEALERALAELGAGTRPAAVAERIAKLGPEVAPAIHHALAELHRPADDGRNVAGPRHDVLQAAARRLGRGAFSSFWGQAAVATGWEPRLATIELVGLVGNATDLRIALLATAPMAPGGEIDARVGPALAEAAGVLVGRDRAALPALRPAILGSSPELASRLVMALGHAEDPRAPQLLVDLLGFDARLDLPVLSELGGCTGAARRNQAESWAERVRPYLDREDRQLVRAAARALGALEDAASVEALVELSARPDRGVSTEAFAALRRISGLSFPDRADRWRSWLAAEREWQRTRAPALLEALRNSEVARVCAALTELSLHPLDRRRQVPLVASFLEHENPRVRVEACRTLRILGPELAREALERATGDRAPSVAAAAASALGREPGVE